MASFGEKSNFGIEASLSQHDNFIYIQYCIYIKGVAIGNPYETTLLSAAMVTILRVLRHKGQRHNAELMDLSEKDIASILVEQTWVSEEDRIIVLNKNLSAINIDFSIYDIGSHETETFNGFYIFLIEASGFDLILGRYINNKGISSYKAPKNEIYRIWNELYIWISANTRIVLKEQE